MNSKCYYAAAAASLVIAGTLFFGCSPVGSRTAKSPMPNAPSDENSAVKSESTFTNPGSLQTGINGNLTSKFGTQDHEQDGQNVLKGQNLAQAKQKVLIHAGGGALDSSDSILLPEDDREGNTATKTEQGPRNLVWQRIGVHGGAGGGGSGSQSHDLGVDLPDRRSLLPASSLPDRSEELWVISKPDAAQAPATDDNTPGCGALMAVQDQKLIPCPLQHTDVKARIDAYIASVDVTQQYANPFSEKIEADYLFPLPENAAVNEFVMQIGDRTIRGIIREREEAKQIYQAARQQGYTASLLEQQRPNVFQQKVANIEPGKKIDIHIRYFHTLQYTDGWYEFDFPMVVAPRFNPPGTTDGIGGVALGQRGTSGQSTETQYLAPNQRSGHDISLTVALNAGVKIEEMKSVNHKIDQLPQEATPSDGSTAMIQLASSDTLPNKDFVLRWRVAGGELKTNVIAQRDKDGNGGYFAMLLIPPATDTQLARRPVDLCFVLDISGSMSGTPIEQSKAAMMAALSSMQSGDTFEVIRFASATESLADHPLPASAANIRKAMQFVQGSEAGGGTMMLDGITKALNAPTDETRTRYLCLLSDGQIGNEAELIHATKMLHGPTRVFGFGVGSSPNRFLFDGMSRAGAGAVAYLSNNEKGEDIMRPFFNRIAKPAMTNIAIDTANLPGAELTLSKIPDCYVGRAVVVTGRYKGDGGSITVRGRVGDQVVEKKFDVKPTDRNDSALASVWARQQIAAVCDNAVDAAGSDAPAQIKSIALQYGLLSSYTSYVAVDTSHVTAGEHGVSVVQPLPIPDGERYDTQITQGAR